MHKLRVTQARARGHSELSRLVFPAHRVDVSRARPFHRILRSHTRTNSPPYIHIHVYVRKLYRESSCSSETRCGSGKQPVVYVEASSSKFRSRGERASEPEWRRWRGWLRERGGGGRGWHAVPVISTPRSWRERRTEIEHGRRVYEGWLSLGRLFYEGLAADMCVCVCMKRRKLSILRCRERLTLCLWVYGCMYMVWCLSYVYD